jgi:hypothetical protein
MADLRFNMTTLFHTDKVNTLLPKYKSFLETEVYPVELGDDLKLSASASSTAKASRESEGTKTLGSAFI